MKVYIQAKNGVPADQDHFNAYVGFKEMGIETLFFETYEELSSSNIETNNTCSIGSYGLEPILYAKFLFARWSELTGTKDECKF